MDSVTGKYPDDYHHSRKRSFSLKADQSFNPYTWKPPIHWEGFVGGEYVKFTQIDSSGTSIDYFDWQDFPSELDYVKSFIVKAIDDAMRVMD